MNEDFALTERVREELTYEPGLNATHIGVSTSDGVVTLTGYTASLAEIWLAEETAARVHGVKAVTHELTVRLADEKKIHDDEIAHRVCRILEWEAAIPADRIHVSVRHGLVTLHGDVDGEYQREVAEKGVRRLSGVTGVVNRLQIKPGNQADHVMADVRSGIEKALRRQADLIAERITVSAADGRVSLSGSVRSHREHLAVRHAAWSCPGVIEVEDHLHLAP